jgi:flagellar hook-basal body complex protein FliE
VRIDHIQSRLFSGIPELHPTGAPDKGVPSFKETLASFLDDVNGAQKNASDAQTKFLTGETSDVHRVMSASEEGQTAFNLLMELRNKTVDGYQELMRIRL